MKKIAAEEMYRSLKDLLIRPGATPENQPMIWRRALDAIALYEEDRLPPSILLFD